MVIFYNLVLEHGSIVKNFWSLAALEEYLESKSHTRINDDLLRQWLAKKSDILHQIENTNMATFVAESDNKRPFAFINIANVI